LICDGTAVSRTTYSTLFSTIGTLYGTGDGSTTFNIPDLRGRMTVGKGTHTDVDALGDNDGAAIGSRTPKHKHTVAGDHGHSFQVNGAVGTGGAGTPDTGTTTVGPQTNTPTDTPAYLTVQYLIRAI